MNKHVPKDPGKGGPLPPTQDVALSKALSERYLAYALATITSRSLPDARDGLKPVQRRLLYAMRLLRLDPKSGPKKCARVVGDVIGKYHPHGDQSVYDALVRLAQDFAQRYPLVDGQGNFGNVDGDNAAAMRYTEARLTVYAELLLNGIDEDAVDFRPTYDGEESEPVVLPAAFPNLLANGASGIAVGMATSIPPHNLSELADACLHLIKFPNATVAKLVDLAPGPDFPTGGVLIEPKENILQAYKTGRGSFRLRARWKKEDLGRGAWQIVVSEIPYQVPKSRLVETMAGLMTDRKLPLLGDIRDESADDIRLVLEPKSRNVEADVLMESLFRATDLEVRLPLNLNVLDQGRKPTVMSLKQALQAFLDHRHEVLVRGAKFRLAEIERRLEVLSGLLIAYLNLDAIIKIVRNEDEPKPVLMRRFKLSDVQAEAILNMRLRALRKLEEKEIAAEHARHSAERKDLNRLLRDKDIRWQRIAADLRDLKKSFAGLPAAKRRTVFAVAPVVDETPLEAMIEKEPITVLCSEKGWIRAVKGHGVENDGGYKEGDGPRFKLETESTAKLLLFGSNGRAYTIPCDRLSRGRGHGEPVRLMIELGDDHDVVSLFVFRPEAKVLLAAADGRGLIALHDQMLAQTRQGKQVLNLSEGVRARICVPAVGDHVAVIGENRKLLIFGRDEVPEMARGRGVRLQKYRDGQISDAKVFVMKQGLSWFDSAGREHVEANLRDWKGMRAQSGRLAPRGFSRSNRFA